MTSTRGASLEAKLSAILATRTQKGLLRTLSRADPDPITGEPKSDFSSNDYLGLARSHALQELIQHQGSPKLISGSPLLGSTGSRLLSGNHPFYEEIEAKLARFHHAQAGLLFNSGFDANLGFFGSVPQRGDVVFYDELIHASVHEGMRVSRATQIPFAHNSPVDLRNKIQAVLRAAKQPPPSLLVAVETVYSMDGDLAPLVELAAVCEEFGANLVVDEVFLSHLLCFFGNL